jgi:hypothetical protein
MTSPYLSGMVQIRPQYIDSSEYIHEDVLWWIGTLGTRSNYLASQLTEMQSAFDTGWAGFWPNIAPNTAHYIGSIVTDFSNDLGLQIGNSGYSHVPGANDGAEAPQQAALLVSLHEQQRYKGGHGRIYLPCLYGPFIDDGRTINTGIPPLVASGITDTVNALFALDSTGGGPVNFTVFHTRTQVEPKTDPPTYKDPYYNVVQSWTVQSVLATQRRRLRKAAHR